MQTDCSTASATEGRMRQQDRTQNTSHPDVSPATLRSPADSGNELCDVSAGSPSRAVTRSLPGCHTCACVHLQGAAEDPRQRDDCNDINCAAIPTEADTPQNCPPDVGDSRGRPRPASAAEVMKTLMMNLGSRMTTARLLMRISIVHSPIHCSAEQAPSTGSRQPHDLVLMSTCELSIHCHGAANAEAVQSQLSEVPVGLSTVLLFITMCCFQMQSAACNAG